MEWNEDRRLLEQLVTALVSAEDVAAVANFPTAARTKITFARLLIEEAADVILKEGRGDRYEKSGRESRCC